MNVRMARMQDICEIRSGGTPSRSRASFYGGGIPWAKISDIERANGILTDTEESITPAGLDAIRGRIFDAGTLLFAIYGSIGKMAFAGRPLATNQAILGLTFREGCEVFPRYVYHWLFANNARFLGDGQGIAQKNLSAGYLRDLEIPLPPIEDQQRITAILDKADALRRKREQALDLLDSLTQSIFLEMFGSQSSGCTHQLSDLVESPDRINYGVVQPGEDVPDGTYLVRVSDLRNGRVNHSNLRKVSKQISAKHGRSILKGNEILISCVGSIGEIAITSDAEIGFNIARAVARVPLNDKILRIYAAEYLRSPNVQRYFTRELRTVSQPTLNIKQISETQITIPSESELKEFDHRVRSVGDGLELARLQASHSPRRKTVEFDR